MEVTGKLKQNYETQTVGSNGFRKRECVVTTSEQYPQDIKIEFNQDKCDLLNKYKVGDDVKISINLRGREWVNPEGKAVYFNTIQGWRIEKATDVNNIEVQAETVSPSNENEPDDLPFK